MRKGFLACTCTLGVSAAIGFAVASGAFGQDTTTPAQGTSKSADAARVDASRPGFFQRLFRRPQTQVQRPIVPAQTPATAVASKSKSPVAEPQKSPIRPVNATSQHVPIPEIPT